MRYQRSIAALCGVLSLGACKGLDVPDYNAASLSGLQANATAAAIGTAAIGVLAASRAFNTSFLQSFVVVAGEQGREGINLDPSNGEDVHQALQSPLGSSEPNYAGWQGAYKLVKQANVLLHALDSTSSISDQQKEAVRGFAQTLKALSFMRINLVFSLSGAPINVDVPPTSNPPAIALDGPVKLYIVALLDSAKTHLLAGGAAFPFALTSGFAGFSTPATFLKFNRGLRARAAVYMSNWADSLQALSESFIDAASPLNLGVFDIYSLNSGDQTNPMYDPTCRQLFSISQNRSEAQKQADGVTLDQRYLDKILDITPKVSDQIPVDACFKLYPSPASPLGIIRNEELFLLRAEARLRTGDRVGALADVNFIRTTSGKLAAIPDPGATGGNLPAYPDKLLDEILYNRRYSLIWEQGARWADARRYGFLGTLPKALPLHVVWPYFPLPTDECIPRTPTPPGCTTPTPL